MLNAGAMVCRGRFAWVLVLAVLTVLVGACAARAAPVAPSTTAVVDITCRSDVDCVVKDVGNCCGYYPACVNRDSEVLPQRVKAECARRNMVGTCGFPQIASCTCSAGRCAAKTGPVEGQ